MAAVLSSLQVEDYPSIEDIYLELGQEYIRVWEEINQRKAPEKLMPLFVGFFLWYNVVGNN